MPRPKKKSEVENSDGIRTTYTLCKGIDDLHPYEVKLPPPPKPQYIINYGLPVNEQVFRRTVIPKHIKALNYMPREQAIQRVLADKEIQDFILMMWYKFTHGEWQYINGEALHISPTYWFYLNFWKMDIGLPQFRYDKTHYCTDLWEFIWWDYLVQPSDVCYGEIQGSKRRGGKCFGKDTPIRMYDGSVKMVQDIKEGDCVMGDDSTKRVAYGITKGEEQMYRITPNNGEPFVCNESHILYGYCQTHANIYSMWAVSAYVKLTIREYLKLTEQAKKSIRLVRVVFSEKLETNYRALIEFTVENIGHGDYYGFAVDDNHLFLLADGTIVHNTYKAMCKAYKRIVERQNAGASIQSKTEVDAVNAFLEKMVNPWTHLPFFFKPYHSNSTYPKKEGLQFNPKSTKGKSESADMVNPDEYLFSRIIPLPSSEKAADGYKWHVHISDEDGKVIDADVWERHIVIKPALTQDGVIIGKEICTTTVEDMEKGGGEKFCYKWRMSDRNPDKANPRDVTVNEEGETVSGLWQWFCPARCNEVQDEFGCAIIETPTPEQKEWLRVVKKDKYYMKGGRQRVKERIDKYKTQVDKHKEMRKYPEEVKDMFIASSSICYFDLGIINERLKHFWRGYEGTDEASLVTFGNFAWKDGVFGGDVVFLAGNQEDSKFWVSYIPANEHQNKWKKNPFTDKKMPANWHKFCAGADAFKFDTEDVINKKDMSKGSLHVYAEFDITVDRPDIPPSRYVTDDFCVEYIWREDSMTVDDLCEDYLMCCIFYGCKLFPEKNNPEVVSYFKRHRFEHYLEFDREYKRDDEGIYLKEKAGAGSNTDSKSVQSMFKVTQRYVKEKGMRCKFYRTLEQFKSVSPDNMNPFDLFVSASTCLRVVQEFNPIILKEDEQTEDIGDIVGQFSAGVPSSSGEGDYYGTDFG